MKKQALAVLLSFALFGCGGSSFEKETMADNGNSKAEKNVTPVAAVKPYLGSDVSQFQMTEAILKDIVKAETEASFVIKQLADAQERYMGMPGKGEYTSDVNKLIDAKALASEDKYEIYQKRSKDKYTLVLDGGYVVREELIDVSPLKNRFRYVATPPERFKGLDVPTFITSDEIRQYGRQHSIPDIEVHNGSYHAELLDVYLNQFFRTKDNSLEERVRQTKESLFILQNAIDNYKKENGKLPQADLRELLYDYRRAEISKNTLLKHFPQELVSVAKSELLLSAGRQIFKELNSTGGWYYNPATGKVQVNWDKPLGSEWGKFTGQKPSEWLPEDNGKAAVFKFIDDGMASTATRDEKIQIAFYSILENLKETEKKNGVLSATDLDLSIDKVLTARMFELKDHLSKVKDPKFAPVHKLIKDEAKKFMDVLQWMMNLRPDRIGVEDMSKSVREELKKVDPKNEDDLMQVNENIMCRENMILKARWDTLEGVVNQIFNEWRSQQKQ